MSLLSNHSKPVIRALHWKTIIISAPVMLLLNFAEKYEYIYERNIGGKWEH